MPKQISKTMQIQLEKSKVFSEEEDIRRQKAQEISLLTGRLGLLIDKQRIFDRWIIRLRDKKTMQPVWTKRGMNADTILTGMLRWLRKKEKKG